MSEALAKRRDRAIATILAVKEAECDPYLPADVSMRLRKIILDNINDLFMAACADEPPVLYNELIHKKIEEIYEVVVGRSG